MKKRDSIDLNALPDSNQFVQINVYTSIHTEYTSVYDNVFFEYNDIFYVAQQHRAVWLDQIQAAITFWLIEFLVGRSEKCSFLFVIFRFVNTKVNHIRYTQNFIYIWHCIWAKSVTLPSKLIDFDQKSICNRNKNS